MHLRPSLQSHIKWQLGNGRSCKAFGQPWHTYWKHFPPNNAIQRNLTVRDLIDTASNTWRAELLIQLFGFSTALYIATQISVPSPTTLHADRLVFTFAANGLFSLKKAYQLIVGPPHATGADPAACKLIWSLKGVIPRIQLFVWKGLHNSIPVGDTFNARMNRQLQQCPFMVKPLTTFSMPSSFAPELGKPGSPPALAFELTCCLTILPKLFGSFTLLCNQLVSLLSSISSGLTGNYAAKKCMRLQNSQRNKSP